MWLLYAFFFLYCMQLIEGIGFDHICLSCCLMIALEYFFEHVWCVFSEFLKAKCLMNCEVALILDRKYEQFQQMSDDPMNQISQ